MDTGSGTSQPRRRRPGLAMEVNRRMQIPPEPKKQDAARAGVFCENSGAGSSQTGNLEVEATAELKRTSALGWRVGGAKAGDVSKGASGYSHVGIVEPGMVEHIKRLEANLKLRLAIEVDGPEQARVE